MPRPTDIMSLRIDNGERATLEYADIALSPTRYIASWLRQRGWRLPDYRCLSFAPRSDSATCLESKDAEVESHLIGERLNGADCIAPRRLPVPNMIADLDQAPKERVEKPVWRVAFFGRLEERKGIKLFVDAVQVSFALVWLENTSILDKQMPGS